MAEFAELRISTLFDIYTYLIDILDESVKDLDETMQSFELSNMAPGNRSPQIPYSLLHRGKPDKR